MPNNLREALQIVRENKRQKFSKNELVGVISSEVDKVATRLRNELLEAVSAKILALPRAKDGEDGEDAPKMEEILDKIEERLPELIKEHSPARNYSLVARRSNAHFEVLTITGTKNGSNREFYLSKAPRIGADLFVFLNGQWIAPDYYTLTGVTLILDNDVPAPESDWGFYVQAFSSR